MRLPDQRQVRATHVILTQGHVGEHAEVLERPERPQLPGVRRHERQNSLLPLASSSSTLRSGCIRLLPYTLFSVAAGTRSIVDQDDETGNRMPQMLRISATAAESVRIAGGAVTDAAGVTLAANAPHVFSSIHRAAQVEVYVDGTSNGRRRRRAATAPTPINSASVHLPFGGSAYWSGTIGEIAVMSDDIGPTSMTSMSEYLKSKWGRRERRVADDDEGRVRRLARGREGGAGLPVRGRNARTGALAPLGTGMTTDVVAPYRST